MCDDAPSYSKWATAREAELLTAFERAVNRMPPDKIQPLDSR